VKRIFRFAPEATYATYDGTTIPPIVLPMDTANSFSPMTQRQFWELMDGSGLNVPRLRGSEVQGVAGRLQTRGYWESVQYLAGWASRVNAAQTAPWGTDQKPNDLASATADFGFTFDDDSYKRLRYLGCKVPDATISSSNAPNNPFLMFDYSLLGSKPIPNAYVIGDTAIDATAFPEPALTDYPVAPLTFQECVFTAYGAARPYFDSFSIKISNKVKAYCDNGRFANRVHCRGRRVTLTVHPLLQVATDARLKYEAVQALGALSIEFTNPVIPGGMTTPDKLKFDFRSKTFLDSVAEEMILDEDAYSTWTATAFLDTAAGDDFAITWTPAAA